MGHPFAELESEYNNLIRNMNVTRQGEVNAVANKLLQRKLIANHIAVSEKTGVPALWIAAVFEREASSNFNLALGQGDPWNKVSVHVPKGRGPFASWADAAEYYLHYNNVDDHPAPWSMAYAAWQGEAYNGFGPRNHGRYSGYLWAGTSFYDPPTGKGGKYIEDGVWSPSTVDKQLGIMPLLVRMSQLRPDLAINGIPIVTSPSVIPDTPAKLDVIGGNPARDTKWVQHAFNQLGWTPALVEDNSLGKITREALRRFQTTNTLPVTGLIDAATITAIEAALVEDAR